jgi:hypothetical protein
MKWPSCVAGNSWIKITGLRTTLPSDARIAPSDEIVFEFATTYHNIECSFFSFSAVMLKICYKITW